MLKKCQCQPFEVWGFSSNCPNMTTYIDTQSFMFEHEYFQDDYIGQVRFQNDATYFITAAKVPSSYPYQGCELWPPISSNDSRATDPWSSTFGILLDTTSPEEGNGVIQNVHWVFWSRVIRIDGEQRFITYGVTDHFAGNPEVVEAELTLASPSSGAVVELHQAHVQIDIATQQASEASAEWLGVAGGPLDWDNVMQFAYHTMRPPTCGLPFENFPYGPGDFAQWQFAANCRYIGKDYYFVSTYQPGADHWTVARLKYNWGDDPQLPELYCSDDVIGALNESDNFASVSGPYAIVLPSCRANLLSTADQPDEPWVVAIGPESEPAIVTGRALNTYMTTDYWDGSLQEEEVENTIIPVPEESPYEAETWNNIAIRCYNHIDGKDYILFTTIADEPDDQTDSPLADFEEGDLNHGLPGALAFTHGGSEDGYDWITDSTYNHTTSGTFSAKAESSASIQGQANLTIKTQVTENDSDLSFWYILDNRDVGNRSDPFSELTNFPIVENRLQLWIDGTLAWEQTNEDGPFEPATYTTWRQATLSNVLSAGPHTLRWIFRKDIATPFWTNAAYLDDVQFPELLITNDYAGYRRWYYDGEQVRELSLWDWPFRDNEQSTAISGRASTAPDFIEVDRTPGNQGKILIGNPHYLYRIRMDEDHEGEKDETFGTQGHARFTASPAIPPPAGYTNSECQWIDALPEPSDSIADPPWGAYQILPTKGSIQLRGVNGTLRDATVDPINREMRPDEKFVDVLNPGYWNDRVQGWTIKDNGHDRIPHIEVIWRPTLDQPAYPFSTYDNPPEVLGPWAYGMEEDSSVLYQNWLNKASNLPEDMIKADINWHRIRDPRRFTPNENTDDPNTRKPVWNNLNQVISRVYGDTYSRRPQFAWMRPDPEQFPDPESGDDPNYWALPWPSAQWQLVVACHCPSASHVGAKVIQPNAAHCPNCQSSDPLAPKYDEDCDPDNWHITWRLSPAGVQSGFTDFDAVDCNCGCCADNNFVPPS